MGLTVMKPVIVLLLILMTLTRHVMLLMVPVTVCLAGLILGVRQTSMSAQKAPTAARVSQIRDVTTQRDHLSVHVY